MKTDQTKPAGQRKKKAARACIHCQKAHLTCDDSRPCQRCIKRNLATTCTDGARKKAKYLQDIEDAATSSSSPGTPFSTTSSMQTPPNMNTPFGPETAPFQTPNFLNTDPTFLSSSNHLVSTPPTTATSSSPFNTNNMPTTSTNNHTPPPPPTTTSNNNSNRPITSISSSAMGTSQISSSGISTLSAYGDGAVVANVASPVTASTGPAVRRRNQIITPEMAYASATKPFSYADGYHYLINYVKTRMSREDLMRISRALALFRPSVLASMMNLTEDDLVFTEKCLQRTLLEYEKLISYSGTPTVVWRRTGEITLVGKEFSLLTQWSRDMLLSKKTYIYELMSNPSAVEYWEKYALHAFDNTDSAVYSTCILMSPTKRIVPCTFCFTIKRDIFDLPSVIVGNFLPILS
ncbi:Zn(2)-C6 fungal-specific transcription factor [Mucor lusitanicus]|uniref:Zn(2)-C6 fungal-specific transcription factor n=1 Tax=Mucor circinelloides f. lusitanicus TaxID=29924 RepID=A0A8H4BIT5_MUCCL|nr:Zn(2)-C6 fungal-specific transcription factor [Mucor lusitanicus]